jgi:hypothetical protein
MHVHQARWIEGGHVHKRITLTPEGGGDARVYTEHVRLLTLDDFRRLYAAAGLRLVGTFGDYDGGPHGPESPRLILHAEKPVG